MDTCIGSGTLVKDDYINTILIFWKYPLTGRKRGEETSSSP